MKAILCALFVLGFIVDTYCIKLNECPPGYRCQKKINQFRFARSLDSQNQDDYEPEICPAGKYSKGGASDCTPCENGTFAAHPGLPACTDCPIGHMCPQTDTEPEQCPLGSYNDQKCQTCCHSCPSDKFAWLKGMSACYSCPSGHRCKVAPQLACEKENK